MKKLNPKLQDLWTARVNMIVAWEELASQAVAAEARRLDQAARPLRQAREQLAREAMTPEQATATSRRDEAMECHARLMARISGKIIV